MEIRVQSIKFDADQKLLDFVEKKLARLEKFYDEINDHFDWVLEQLEERDMFVLKSEAIY